MPIYLLLNLFTVIIPLIMSFEKRLYFFKEWTYIWKGMIFTAFIFIIWDICFTHLGIWSFNSSYLIGINLLGLPIEEWLFFFTVPFACLFIYHCLNLFTLPKSTSLIYFITGLLGVCLISISLFTWGKTYTQITFLLSGIFLLVVGFLLQPTWIYKFWITYFIHLIPFFLVNGILTSLPIVSYDHTFNLSIRIGHIPIEDIFYSLLLLLMNILSYEYFRQKRSSPQV